MPGRSWEGGLHQLIETKESCEVTAETEVLARISYQRFFRRYLALGGMTGTAREAARELWSVYRRQVVSIPTHKPMILRGLPPRIYRTADEKWAALVERIRELHAAGRPVLVGTRTVSASEHLARLLDAAGIPCRVLNALQDAKEAEIIADAGHEGRITVATNMAGRGTDIKPTPEVVELGGLHVIATEWHDAGRIDRQLFGRSGRQGDPGSYEAFASLEDEILRAHPVRILGRLGADRLSLGSPLGRRLFSFVLKRAQRKAERGHSRIRRELLKFDESVDTALAFSGRGE
jgi:preprotein translocase subunit SecA